ncbi:MAG: ABC transporter ATP-binding protein [Anaerolineales bacterium]|nr:ABC transporter ATP-binding protein [Anaerolineales bacterium]
MTTLIEARDLHRAYGANRAVDGLSLTVRAGEAYGLVGPDGAGKTTTMRLLVGALRADRGEIQVGGYVIGRQTEQARAHLGYLAQRFSLYGDLTVAENLEFFGAMRGVRGPALARRAAELLKFVGLAGFEDRPADKLSGGMKQKLGLACALIHEPRVLLLDEPTGGVDPVTRQDFWQLLIRVLAEGTAVIVSTPYMDEAARCTRVGFMYRGRILVEGAPRELTAAMQGRVLELAAHPKDRAKALAAADPDVEDVLTFGDRFHVRVRETAGPLARLPEVLAQAGVAMERLRPIAPSLEDVFISLLAAQAAAADTP